MLRGQIWLVWSGSLTSSCILPVFSRMFSTYPFSFFMTRQVLLWKGHLSLNAPNLILRWIHRLGCNCGCAINLANNKHIFKRLYCDDVTYVTNYICKSEFLMLQVKQVDARAHDFPSRCLPISRLRISLLVDLATSYLVAQHAVATQKWSTCSKSM